MRKAMAGFGVNEQSIPLIEAAYEEFLDLFDAHLAHAPYLLGGRPTIGDYGLIGPLFAHLARDPYPSLLMKRRAHRVWRWVERMNSADLDSAEYGWPAPSCSPTTACPTPWRPCWPSWPATTCPRCAPMWPTPTNGWPSGRTSSREPMAWPTRANGRSARPA
ncbi:hypothetical protein CSW58_03550 [Caulobacter sp. B11]|nr:hypothetical protein CSW58_03550 [Caulobacter sp. B11]